MTLARVGPHDARPLDSPSISSSCRFQVAWGDCDPAGIIYYPTYFHWFDTATWTLFATVGLPIMVMRAQGRMMPLVAADIQFHHPAVPGDQCEVRSSIARWGGKSFVVRHEARRADGKLLATGSETRVWVTQDGAGQPLASEPVPDEVKALFVPK